MWLFTKEAAVGIVRTVMPFVWGFLVAKIPGVLAFVESIGLTEESLIVVGGGVLYTLIRAVAEKIPAVGYLLVFNTKPEYDLPEPTGDAGAVSIRALLIVVAGVLAVFAAFGAGPAWALPVAVVILCGALLVNFD